jgi:hypothetical protein
MRIESSSRDPAATRIGGKAESVRGIADIKEIARLALDAWAERLEPPSRATAEPAGGDFSPATLWKIRRDFQELTTGDGEEFVAVLNRLLRDRDQIVRSLIVWIDLIDTLVHQAERRYPLPGRGQLKRSEVKSAIVYLVRRRRLNIPNIPSFLEPVVVDIYADFTVNVIVSLTNDNGLWDLQESSTPAHPVLRSLKWALFRFWRFIRPAIEPIGRLFVRIYLALRYPTPISPALRQALEAVSRDSLTASRGGLINQAIGAKQFIGEHAGSLVAGVRLIASVVKEVERFASLSGPAKKRYATNLVRELLPELGIRAPGPVMELVIEAVVGFVIDAVVDLFNKRNLFSHPSGTRVV